MRFDCKKYRTDNTEGYTSSQLGQLNEAWDGTLEYYEEEMHGWLGETIEEYLEYGLTSSDIIKKLTKEREIYGLDG